MMSSAPKRRLTPPDVVVVCGKIEFEDDTHPDTLLNPKVIFEILSESTEGYYRGKKFEHYRKIPALAEFALIAQDTPHVEVHTRQGDGRWLLWETNELRGVVPLQAIECSLNVSEIYARVFSRPDAG